MKVNRKFYFMTLSIKLLNYQGVNILKFKAMKKNMGSFDSIIRLVIAAAIAILIFMGVINGTVAIILGIVDVVILFTIFFSFCPLYAVFKCDTRAINKEEEV